MTNSKPSWLRWPPNCCETCSGPWEKIDDYTGRCGNGASLEFGLVTDSRFRCPNFQRKPDEPAK